jgi:catechol-2,3-dioxygenase
MNELSVAFNRKVVLLAALLTIIFASSGAQTNQQAAHGSVSIKALDHVALNITDLQRSANWYHDVFGFEVFHKWNTTWMIHRKGMKIGLFLRPNAASIGDTDNKLAITHFAFVTSAHGFADAQVRLKKLGIKFDPPEDTGIAFSIFLSDPDGYQVEITTYHK